MSAAIRACSIFFRSTAYRYAELVPSGQRWVVGHHVEVEVAGRCVLLGDHPHVVKDGGRMPGVVSLRETSETQSKPSYCRGQGWGALGMLVGSLEAYFCLPFQVQLQHGFRHRGESEASGKRVPLRLAERVVELALAFAIAHDRPSGVVLEACFAVASVFRLARSVDSVVRRQPDVQLVGRAKKNYVASFPAAPKAPQRCGPQPRYGDKIVLWEGFDQPPLCEEVTAQVYGKTETVRLLATPLLWTPLGDGVFLLGPSPHAGRSCCCAPL